MDACASISMHKHINTVRKLPSTHLCMGEHIEMKLEFKISKLKKKEKQSIFIN